MIYVFADTNFFMHYKHISQINWTFLSPHFGEFTELTVLIPNQVLREIDNHKNSESKKRTRRVRLISEILKKIENNGPIIVESNDLRATLDFAPISKIDFGNYPMLQPNLGDDIIIAEALEFPKSNLIILSSDTLLRRKAKALGLLVSDIPDEFKLPQEQDESVRLITALQRELKLLKNLSPTIDFHLGSTGQDFEICIYETNKKSEQIARVCAQIINNHPMRRYNINNTMRDILRAHASLSMQSFFEPSDSDIKKYEDEDYPAWIGNLRHSIEAIYEEAYLSCSLYQLSLFMQNTGSAVGEDCILAIKGYNGLLVGYCQEQENRTKIPPPPDAPVARNIAMFSLGSSLLSPIYRPNFGEIHGKISPPTDPYEFYENTDMESVGAYIEFTASKIMHQTEEKLIKFVVSTSGLIAPMPKLEIKCHVSNSPEPLKRIFDFKTTREEFDFISWFDSNRVSLM